MTLGDFIEFKELMLYYKSAENREIPLSRLEGVLTTIHEPSRCATSVMSSAGSAQTLLPRDQPPHSTFAPVTLRDESKLSLSP